MRNSIPTRSRQIVAIASIACVLLGFAPVKVVRAQTSGTLRGQVFDDAGHPLPGVRITITNVESGNAVSVQTDEKGNYLRTFLFPGSYRVTASKEGFTDGGVDIRVPLNNTTEIKPPDITIRPATTSTATQPPVAPATTTQQAPTPASESDSSILINKSDATRGGNFTSVQLWTLPLGGGNTMRSFDELAFLLSGVAPPPYTPGVRGPGVGFGIGTAGEFSVNGMRARSNNFNIDGSDNNDPDVGVRRQGFVALVPQSIESVQEFQISTLLWNAELGRNMGSQVNAVSRAGSKAIHGQAYGFLTDSSSNARNAFNSSGREDPFTRSQVGIVIGGPIVRDRAQFFGSFEHVGVNSSITQHFSSPTLLERRFAFNRFQVVDAVSPPVRAGAGGTTPVGKDVFSLFPSPNNVGGPFGNNTYTEVLPADGDASIASFRVTGSVAPNSTLTGRYNFTDDSRVLPSVNQAIRSTIEAKTRTQNLAIILNSGITGNLLNQARFSYGRSRIRFPEFNTSPFLLPGDKDVLGPIGEIVIEPFSPVGVDVFTFPQGRENETFQFADTLSYNYRSHSLKGGTDIRLIHLDSFQDRLYRPLVVFGEGLLQPFNLTSNGDLIRVGDFSVLSGVESAALGLPSSILQTITAGKPDSHIRLRSVEYNFFFNDSWRVTPKLSIDYGLRYEYNSVPRERDRRIENALSLQSLATAGGSRFDDPAATQAFNDAVSSYKQILDGRKSIYNPDKNNLGPHIGFAWSPAAERGLFGRLFGPQSGTVIRGGYGIYYDTILGAVVSQSRNVFPTEIPINITPSFAPFSPFALLNPSFLQLVTIDKQGNAIISDPLLLRGTNQFGLKPEDFVAAIGTIFRINNTGDPGGGLAFTLPQKNLRTPYAQQWHLTFERQLSNDYLVSAAYVGTKGTKLTRLATPNGGPTPITFVPVVVSVDQQPLEFPAVINFLTTSLNAVNGITRPFPALGAFQIFENTASSNYHALQLEARKRYSHGYQFTVAYTWSHAIDDVSDVFPISGAPVLPQGRNSGSLGLDDPANFIASERADANYDIRQRFVMSLIWDLPFYRDSYTGVARWLGGWQVSSIFQAHTGQPFTINLPFDDNGDGNLSDRPVSAVGLITSTGHGSRRLALLPRIKTLTDINDSFGEKAVINQVRIGRNSFRGDNFRNLDLALTKRFRFTENQSLDFRTEMFNSLNRANYGLPVRILSAPGFGTSYETVNPARIIQFALKYSF
jgi:carboxypeptidase family protein